MSNRITKLLTAAVLIGAPASALASPRTLPSGAPACGNTMGKGGYNDDCTSEQRAAWRAERDRQRAAERRHEAQQRALAQQRQQAKALEARVRTVAELIALAIPRPSPTRS